MISEFDITLDDGRTLHAYDTGTGSRPVFWHHGTPNLGTPPKPLFDASRRLGLRWISYDRPNYGGSTPLPDRTIGSAADHVAQLADHLGIERFAVMGHSGGGSHALGAAALLPQRTVAAVSAAGLTPFTTTFDWYAGMCASGRRSLTAAAEGRAALEKLEQSDVEYDPEFTVADLAALHGDWSWFDEVVGPAAAAGPGGLIDDDLAYVRPWAADPADIVAPVLLLHGEQDRIVPSTHSRNLATLIPGAELRLFPEDGHISVITHAGSALDWLTERWA